MDGRGDSRELAPLLGELLEYPPEDFAQRLAHARARLLTLSPPAAEALARFGQALALRAPAAVRELYTRSFDIAPQCIAYLSVHLFGEESFKRAELMTQLARIYRERDFDCGRELPDHLAVVLRFAPKFTGEEWCEMCEYCLGPGLERMEGSLERAANPYVELLRAARIVLALAPAGETSHA